MGEATDIVSKLSSSLYEHGPWAMCAILVVMLVALYLHMSKKHTSERKELWQMVEKRNNQLLSALQRCINALKTSSQTNQECKDLIKESNEVLRRVDKDILRCEMVKKISGDDN